MFLRPLSLLLITLCALVGVTSSAAAQCSAFAGTLSPLEVEINSTRDTFFVSAFRQENVVLPETYSIVFVLTSGEDRNILASSSSPFFRVTTPGIYRIHTVIAQVTDTASADYVTLASLSSGTLAAVTASLEGVCADVDATGVMFDVRSDVGVACAIGAGSLAPVSGQLSDDAANVTLLASVSGEASIPAGYEQRYVLTRGPELLIIQVGEQPTFTVPANVSALYTIHSFVAELTDAAAGNYFDPARIVIGTTVVDDIINFYVQQDVCASFDATGAQIFVGTDLTGDRCISEPGKLVATSKRITAVGDSAVLTAARTNTAFLAASQELAYVLTEGPELRIIAIGNTPQFTVGAAGNYRIHSIAAELSDTSSSEYVDVSIVEFGVTTAAQLLDVARQTGICIALDGEGAQFTVAEGELIPSGVFDQAPESATFHAWQAAAGQDVNLRIKPATSVRGQLTVELRDVTGRLVSAVYVQTLGDAMVTAVLPTSARTGFHVVSVRSASGALSSRGIVLR